MEGKKREKGTYADVVRSGRVRKGRGTKVGKKTPRSTNKTGGETQTFAVPQEWPKGKGV